MQNLFITRNLQPGSPLKDWAEREGVEVIDRSLLRFAAVSFTPPKDSDWWFFYSPRAVEFGLDRLAMLSLPLPKLAAMGPGTARALQDHDYCLKPDFVGQGGPDKVAEAFGELAEGQRVFFPRARQSRMTVQRLLQGRIIAEDTICYDNQAVEHPEYVSAEVYVFTSPLNARTYLQFHVLPVGARVIAIGPSTAQALAGLGIRAEVAGESSEEGVLAML